MRARVSMRSWVCAALVIGGCGSDPTAVTEQTFPLADGQDAFTGTGSRKLLSKAELAAYVSDRGYIRHLAKPGVAMTINHADPQQHRFALARMKLAGKTPENSPELFKLMDGLPSKHAARGLVAGQMLAQATAVEGGLESQHMMRATVKTPTVGRAASGSLASRKDALSYGYVDCSVYDGNGNALGDPTFIEIYGNMTAAFPTCDGDLSLAQVPSLQGDSFLVENPLNTDEMNQSYIVGRVISLDAAQPTLSTPTITHPFDITNNGTINLCLERSNSDCDYNNLGTLKLDIPLQGSITIANATFDPVKIGQYQRGQDSGSQIYVTLSSTHGGGCTLPAFGMTNFWNNITFTATQLNWDLYSDLAKWPQFSTDCHLVQDRVELTMDLNLPYTTSSFSGTLPVEITTTGGAPTAPNYHIATPIRVTNSCLAAGTRIATAGGEARKIEDLHIGDTVVNPYAAQLTVADTTVGTESTPMVKIVDSRGHELLMTEMHPLSVVDRGMIAAKHLKVGDRVNTEDGPSELVGVTRQSYGGQVYNLKVGNAKEALALGVDQSVMYANGFLVGDVQIQDKYQFMDLRTHSANDKLSVRWQQDYQTSRGHNELAYPHP